jgi:hypothetical protein
MKTLPLLAVLVCLTPVCPGQITPAENGPVGRSFIPDTRVDASSLKGWTTLGSAQWSTQDGEFVGSAKTGSGLLVLDHGYQDVGIHTMFKVVGGEIGFVFRLETTPQGMKGVMVSIKDDQVASYGMTFDSQGKELSRERLRAAGSIVRMAPLANPNAATARRGGGAGRGRGGAGRGGARGGSSPSPLVRPSTAIRPGEWNQIEMFLDLNIIRSFVNDGGETAGGAADEIAGKFGPIALFVGPGAEARFKDLGYKDLADRSMPAEKTGDRFTAQRINDMYYSWGCAAADFNRDGNLDIVAGPYIYYGPDFTHFREVYPAVPFNPSREFTDVNCQYTFDFNGDGWPDILTGPPKAFLYINPKGESRRWDKFEVISSIQTEITVFRDIDGSGVPALIYGADGELRYAKPDMANPTKPWVAHAISERGMSMAHGIGVGDINGDGKMDVVNANGWWEQPAEGPDHGPWKYHPEAFGRYGHRSGGVGGAVMAVYDVNGDGLNDVVTSLNAHGFGLAWFEQKRDAAGKISFIRHMIADDYSTKNAGDVTFSEQHGSTFADIDGDGIPDFIVGKRYFSHLDDFFDPDPYGAPVLYVYRTVRNPKAPGGAEFVPELIHNRSGAGSDILAVDLKKDGKIDIVTSTDRGTFIFWNKGSPAKPSAQATAAPKP